MGALNPVEVAFEWPSVVITCGRPTDCGQFDCADGDERSSSRHWYSPTISCHHRDGELWPVVLRSVATLYFAFKTHPALTSALPE
jgi:hypothetical protein